MEADNAMISAPLSRRIKLAVMRPIWRFQSRHDDCLRFWHSGCWNAVYLNISKMAKMTAEDRGNIYGKYHEADRSVMRPFVESFIDSYKSFQNIKAH